MKHNTHMDTGRAGESIACNFLLNKGFFVQDRNYRRKWGEIDVVALKDGVLHFVEVKSISVDTWEIEDDAYRPEENVHVLKQRKLIRAIETYLYEHNSIEDINWQFDVIIVYLHKKMGVARLDVIWNVLLGE